jgi:hypothetical protein
VGQGWLPNSFISLENRGLQAVHHEHGPTGRDAPYEDAPTYAWVRVGRLDACSTDQAARAEVEWALGEVGS